MTVTLRIEHAITDLDTWLGAFARFEEARTRAGVRGQRIHQPADDEQYVFIDLDFDSADQAEGFKRFLESNVWSDSDASPALAGAPLARVLNAVGP